MTLRKEKGNQLGSVALVRGRRCHPPQSHLMSPDKAAMTGRKTGPSAGLSFVYGGGGRSPRLRTGKLLILRLTPRLLRRCDLGGPRSSRISASTS